MKVVSALLAAVLFVISSGLAQADRHDGGPKPLAPTEEPSQPQ